MKFLLHIQMAAPFQDEKKQLARTMNINLPSEKDKGRLLL